MKEDSRTPSIEISDDPEFQRKDWRVQRIGWAFLAVVVLAAGLGLFGGMGPFARRSAVSPDGSLRIEYSAIGRHRAPGELKVLLGQSSSADSTVQIWIDRRYLETSDLLRTTPEPAQSDIGSDHVTYAFQRAGGAGEVSIVFDIEPVKIGTQRGRIGVVGGSELSFSTFVLP